MGSEPILRLTSGQHAKVVRQIRRKCANFDRENGYCLPLDDLCPQTLTLSLLCRYYRAAVLPDDPALEAEIRKTGQRCQICGAWYSPKGRNAKYCPSCAVEQRRALDRQRKRKKANHSAF